jgi:hypothetical protein
LFGLLHRRGFEILKRWIHLIEFKDLLQLSLNAAIDFLSKSKFIGVRISAAMVTNKIKQRKTKHTNRELKNRKQNEKKNQQTQNNPNINKIK